MPPPGPSPGHPSRPLSEMQRAAAKPPALTSREQPHPGPQNLTRSSCTCGQQGQAEFMEHSFGHSSSSHGSMKTTLLPVQPSTGLCIHKQPALQEAVAGRQHPSLNPEPQNQSHVFRMSLSGTGWVWDMTLSTPVEATAEWSGPSSIGQSQEARVGPVVSSPRTPPRPRPLIAPVPYSCSTVAGRLRHHEVTVHSQKWPGSK